MGPLPERGTLNAGTAAHPWHSEDPLAPPTGQWGPPHRRPGYQGSPRLPRTVGTPSPHHLEAESLLFLGDIGVRCEPPSARHCCVPPPGGAGGAGAERGAGPSNFGGTPGGERETRGDRAFWGGFGVIQSPQTCPGPRLTTPTTSLWQQLFNFCAFLNKFCVH